MLNKYLYKIDRENSFSKQKRLINEYKDGHPNADIIHLGIGDVSKPICEPIREAMKKAVDDLASMDSFVGYGHYYGIESLRKTILKNDYENFNFSIDEVFVGCGTKTDSTSILELFDSNAKVLISNPTYPIYLNGALSESRDVYFCEVDKEFKMIVPKEKYDVIYICSPCNPVGNAYTSDELKKWIDYANINKSIIIYDNVYKGFVESENIPKSIYEIEGSRTCAIEMRSYSKDASFSSVRCSYFILPKEIDKDAITLWKERTLTRFNGPSYISQKGAEASYLPEAQEIIKKNLLDYKENSKYLKEELTKLGYEVIGGVDAPYLWVKTKDGRDSWQEFMFYLEKFEIVVVPGAIFGTNGNSNVRISGLGSLENSKRAIERMKKYYEKNL